VGWQVVSVELVSGAWCVVGGEWWVMSGELRSLVVMDGRVMVMG